MSWATIADDWATLMSRALLEGTLVFCVVLAVWWPLRQRAPAQLGSGLFLLVPLKLLLPFEIAVPTGVAALFPASWLSSAGDVASSSARVVFGVAEPPTIASSLDVGALLFAGYLGVVILLSARFLYVQARTARLVRCARPLRQGELSVEVEALRRRAGVRSTVRWLVSDAIESPAAGGLLRPYVLVPAGLLPKLGTRPLAWVLLHELVHIRRGDIAVTWLQRFVQIVFFFHPVVWIANRIVDEQREFACDAEALALSGVGRSECGAGFLSVVEWASGHGVSSAAALAMFDSKSVIKRRLVRIMQHPQQSKFSKLLSGAAVVAVASILLPTVKASPAVEVATTASVQDPDELHKLRSEIRRLEKAHAELRRKLESLGRRQGADKIQAEDEVETEDMEDDADAEEHDGGFIKVEGFPLKLGRGGRWIGKEGKGLTVYRRSGEDGAAVEGFALEAGQGGRWISKDGKGFIVLPDSGEDGAVVKGFALKPGQGGRWVTRVGKPMGPGASIFVDGQHGHVIEEGGDGLKRVFRVRPTVKGEHVIIETQIEDDDEDDGEDQAQVEGAKGKTKVKAETKAKKRIM